jgi:hypothetical protein
MDTQRLSQGQMISGVAGLVLLISLFLKWAGSEVPGTDSLSAWKLPIGTFDIYLLILAFFAMLPAIAELTGAGIEVPFVDAAAAFLLAVIGVVQLVWLLIDPGEGVDLKIGFWIALIATIGIVVGSYQAMNAEVSRR